MNALQWNSKNAERKASVFSISTCSRYGAISLLAPIECRSAKIPICLCTRLDDASAVSESWTLLVHLLDIQDKQAFFKSWKLSNKQIKDIQLQSIGLRDVLENGWSKRIMYTIGEQASVSVNRILQLLRSNEHMNEHELLYIYSELPIHSLKDLDINGQDLLVWTGKKGGPWVSQLLKEIEEKVLYNELMNTKSSIRKWVQSCSQI